ncbi:hypothetical protein, partial [Escherichia coli]|uniref:hypothetical protein n=1 Tax=Escherichia coli TaxID=562 RepID=UPI003EDF977F
RFGSDPHIHVFGKKIHPRRDLLLRFFRQTTQIIPAFTDAQARIVFEDAKNMVRKARSTLGRLFDFNKLAIYQEQSASKFEP